MQFLDTRDSYEMAPSSFADLGKDVRDLFSKGFRKSFTYCKVFIGNFHIEQT